MEIGSAQNTLNRISPVDVTDDREACPKIWVAIYSRPNCEKKLAQALAHIGIESYVPIQTQLRQWSDRKKKVDVVIIPMIVFAKISIENTAYIRTLPHVIRILSLPGQRQPASIPDDQIERLKFMLNNADSDVSFVSNSYNQGDPVEVVRGNLKGLVGYVEITSDGKTNLIIIIEILGGAKVSISACDLKRLNK